MNANGFCQHAQEIKIFIHTLNLDSLLVPETHFNNRSYIKIPNYSIYFTSHPDETTYGGTAVAVRQNIEHFVTAEYRYENMKIYKVDQPRGLVVRASGY